MSGFGLQIGNAQPTLIVVHASKSPAISRVRIFIANVLPWTRFSAGINARGCHSIRKTDQFPVHQPEPSTSVETLHFENMIQCESQSANQSR